MSFRQVNQRHISNEICIMEWSPSMDLIALVTVSGEVHIHRLSWQRVWALPAQKRKYTDIDVTAIAWSPNGKTLAIAYGVIDSLFLIDVENSETIHFFEIFGGISTLSWVEYYLKPRLNLYTDSSDLFLSQNFNLMRNYVPGKTVDDDIDDLEDSEPMHMLAVGTYVGTVQLYAFGVFHCGHIDVEKSEEHNAKVLSVSLSEDFGTLAVVVEFAEGESVTYRYKSFDLPLLRTKAEEFRAVALKYGHVAAMLTMVSATIRAVSEAWEDILLEIDTKLLKYSEKKRVFEGTISDDFLELFMFGTASHVLENFLLHDLTENGLKKFGHSIELSYSNIQKLLLKKLHSVVSCLFYNLSDIKGMALWQERFGELGLSPVNVKAALSSIGSFLMKATEIQQVIDCSMKNFKSFFRWLYSVILRMSDETIPIEITKVNQQDLSFVAEFLKENFAEDWDLSNKGTFKLERVGQYLKNEKLAIPADVSGNPWISFLQKNPAFRDSDVVFHHRPETSLIQEHHEVRKAVELAFSGPKTVFHKSVVRKSECVLFKNAAKIPLKICHCACPESNLFYTAFTKEPLPADHLYLIAESMVDSNDVRNLCVGFGELPSFTLDSSASSRSGEACQAYKICDVKFYKEGVLSVLLVENNHNPNKVDCPVLLQLSLQDLGSDMLRPVARDVNGAIHSEVQVVGGEKYVDKAGHKRLDNCKAVELAVSGLRKVACVLFSSRRQVRLFEMEVEDDDDDAEETDHEESMKKFDRDDPFESPVNPAPFIDSGDKENSP